MENGGYCMVMDFINRPTRLLILVLQNGGGYDEPNI